MIWAPAGILCVGAVILTVGAWGWLLADVLRHESNDGWMKLFWVYAVLLTPPWGGLVYFFARRPDRLREFGE